MKDQECYTTRYFYDSDGNRTLIEYPFNQIIRNVAYTYDYAGRPLSAVLLHSGVLAQGAEVPAVRSARGTDLRERHGENECLRQPVPDERNKCIRQRCESICVMRRSIDILFA